MRRSLSLVAAACLALLAVVVSAQPLADRLPPQTLVYAGWSPAASLQTTLPAKMLADERFVRPWRLLLQQALLSMPDEVAGVGGGRISEHLPQLLTDAAQCEGAFALLDLGHAGRDWKPQAVLVINLGAKRKTFEEHFKPIHDRLKNRLGDRLQMMKLENSWLWSKTTKDVPEYTWGFLGDSFVFYFGDAGDKFLPTLSAPRPVQSLKNAPNFADTLSKIPGDSILTTYVDLSQGLKLVQSLLKDARNSDWAMAGLFWDKTSLALGIDNARALGQKTSVQDDQFITQTLLRTDGPPHGMLAQLVQPAVEDAMLQAVPADAMGAVAVRLDLSKFYDAIKAAATQIAGDDAKKSFDAFEEEAASRGVPVAQLLAPLGDQWVFYNATSNGGFPFIGLTAVVNIRDGEKLHTAMTGLEKFLAKALNGGGSGGVKLTSYEADGLTVRYLQLGTGYSFFTPAYAVVGDKLVVALYPQIVEDAAKQVAGSGKSLLDRPEFIARRAQTGEGGPLVYLSEPEVVRAVYPLLLPLVSLIREFGGVRGDDAGVPQEDLVPSMRRLLGYVSDEAVSFRLTPDGIAATRSVANPLLSPVTTFDAIPLWVAMAAISLPDVAVADNRTKTMNNLRRLGEAMNEYAVQNKKYPPDLESLVKARGLDNDLLSSPFGAGQGADYKYLFANAAVPPADPGNGRTFVVAYDAAELRDGEGATLLYADGHVEWQPAPEATESLKKSEEAQKLLRGLPK